jgi:gentisate 1,2-dioxygenase
MSDAAATGKTHNIDPLRRAFYARIAPQNLGPLWEVLAGIVTKEPDTKTAAHLWPYDAVRPHLLEACELITAEEAERRVLVLENPAFQGRSKVTRSLFSGFQIIQPGEVAPPHRHSQSALRFIIEGRGAYTSVDGERVMMTPGDFIITPSWTWHDHGNLGDGPMVWLDGLDIPMVRMFEASFREGPEDQAADPGAGQAAPVFSYPYADSRPAAGALELDECHGRRLRYTNPETGDDAMPTIATFLSILPAGFQGAPYRATDSMVYVCVEGGGTTTIGGETFSWGPHDVFVVPSWAEHVHRSDGGEPVLFSFSDRGVQEKLGLWREQKGNK